MPKQFPLLEGAAPDFGLVGDSPEIHRVRRFIAKLRNNRSPVLLLGESGTGKDLAARALHGVSPGDSGAFVAVNAGALPSSLIESELFGHVRGSFTGATAARRGLFEQASGGTLFLDEIGELAPEMQVKLLRALEDRAVRPLGGEALLPVDVRVISATNRDLEREMEEGRFRRDLWYRLNVISIRLPPLRERPNDIPLLVELFLRRYAPHRVVPAPAVMQCLAAYDWPGNVRQLENCVQRMVALASGTEVRLADLPTQLRNALENCQWVPARNVLPLAEVERVAIVHAMAAADGNRPAAARLLGIGKTTLYRKLNKYGKHAQNRAAAAGRK